MTHIARCFYAMSKDNGSNDENDDDSDSHQPKILFLFFKTAIHHISHQRLHYTSRPLATADEEDALLYQHQQHYHHQRKSNHVAQATNHGQSS
jgi:hypothetical protein